MSPAGPCLIRIEKTAENAKGMTAERSRFDPLVEPRRSSLRLQCCVMSIFLTEALFVEGRLLDCEPSFIVWHSLEFLVVPNFEVPLISLVGSTPG